MATHLVGPPLLEHPGPVRPTICAWATDGDRWLRRTAVICQVGAKDRLSGLSRREALKHLGG